MFLAAVTLPLHATLWPEIHSEILQMPWNSNITNQELCGTITECYSNFSHWSPHFFTFKLIIFVLLNAFLYTSFSDYHWGTDWKKVSSCQVLTTSTEQLSRVVRVCCVRDCLPIIHIKRNSRIQINSRYIS